MTLTPRIKLKVGDRFYRWSWDGRLTLEIVSLDPIKLKNVESGLVFRSVLDFEEYVIDACSTLV